MVVVRCQDLDIIDIREKPERSISKTEHRIMDYGDEMNLELSD